MSSKSIQAAGPAVCLFCSSKTLPMFEVCCEGCLARLSRVLFFRRRKVIAEWLNSAGFDLENDQAEALIDTLCMKIRCHKLQRRVGL